MKQEIYEKITSKKDFSCLPLEDVKLAFSHFEKRQVSEEEKIRLTRELLHKVFGAFASKKLLSLKDKSPEWILKKHVSTRERMSHYKEVYGRLLAGLENKGALNVFDFGAGVNGFSYFYFPKNTVYFGIEAMGQLVDLMNYFFKANKILKARAEHLSLFDLGRIKNLIRDSRGEKVVFLFKTLDSLEMLERDSSKILLKEIVPLVSRVVVSFATKSLVSRKKFLVKRVWIKKFIEENFKIVDEFEIGGELYLCFERKDL